jgi:hypothetical protein
MDDDDDEPVHEAKKRKLNPIGEDIHLEKDGTIRRDEDIIIDLQRTWTHNAYKPGGVMYKRCQERFLGR